MSQGEYLSPKVGVNVRKMTSRTETQDITRNNGQTFTITADTNLELVWPSTRDSLLPIQAVCCIDYIDYNVKISQRS